MGSGNKSNQALNEAGFQAPARLKRPYWSTYLHIPSGKNYRQLSPGTAAAWSEVGVAGTGKNGGGGGGDDGNGIYGGSDSLMDGITVATMLANTILQFDSVNGPLQGLFTIDAINNRIGIGTVSPSQALHLNSGNAYVKNGALGVGEVPDITQRLRVTQDDTLANSTCIRVDSSYLTKSGNFSGVQIRSTTVKTGTSNLFGLNSNLTGSATAGLHNFYGVRGRAATVASGGTVNNIGGIFEASNGDQNNALQLIDGSEGVGKVLTSDANGLASWTTPAGGGDVLIGNSLYVSSAGDTIANGAVRESISNHFSSLDEAVTEALAGDTIYVYGDNTVSANLAKQDVKYVFSGKGTISSTVGIFYDNNGTSSDHIYVRGDADFVLLTTGINAIYITSLNTKYDIECNSVRGPGGSVVAFHGGTDDSIMHVKGNVECFSVNWTVYLQSNARGTLRVDGAIINSALSSTRSVVLIDSALLYDFKIVGDIRIEAEGYPAISGTVASTVGTLIIEGDVYMSSGDKRVFFWGRGGFMCNANITVNGNVFCNKYPLVHVYGSSCNLIINGDIHTDKGGTLIISGTQLGKVTINGDIISTGSAAPIAIKATSGTFRHNGTITTKLIGADPIAAVVLLSGGTGYTGQTIESNVTTTGGTGTGLTLHVTRTSSGAGALSDLEIDNPGTGYTEGDVVTISGDGNGDATLTVTAVKQSGLLLNDSAGYDVIFDNSKIIVDDIVNATDSVVGYPGNKDIIVTERIASNLPTDNITNLVTGTSIFDDPNIQ